MHSYDQIEAFARVIAPNFGVIFNNYRSRADWRQRVIHLSSIEMGKEGMFTVYHELAHVLLNHTGCFPFSIRHERQENEANYVALGTVLRLGQFDHPFHESWNFSPTMFNFDVIPCDRFAELDRAVSKLVDTYILTIGQPQGTTKVQCQEVAQQSCLPPMPSFGSSFSNTAKVPGSEEYLFYYPRPSASFFLSNLVTSVDK